MTGTTRQAVRAFGLWDSPITAVSLAQGKRLDEPQWDTDGRTLVWLEGRSDRGVLVTSRDDDPAPRDLTADLSVRAMLGYGGGNFAVGRGMVVFVSGGRLYRQEIAGGAARPITPTMGAISSPQISPDGRWVLFIEESDEVDCIAVVDAGGSAWPVKLVHGRDFYMQPRWSHDGCRVAWIAWDFPNMPWDGSELWMGDFSAPDDAPRLSNGHRLAGDGQTAVFQPEFSPDGSVIAYVSDQTGWGHIYVQPADGGEARQLTGGEAEHGHAAWTQGQRSYCFIDKGSRIACVRSERGVHRLQVVDAAGAAVSDVKAAAPYTAIEYLSSLPETARLAFVGSSGTQPARVMQVDASSASLRTAARAMGETVSAAWAAKPEPVSWTSFDGEAAHGLFYPPTNPDFSSPGKPPLVVLIHGGPTSQVTAAYDARAQYLATRGYAVLQVNYRGSTGYGRAYMLKLRGSWGIYDVEDSRTACLYLAEQGLVDERRRVIMGSSAGGFTVLQSLVAHPGFYTAGICMYGVANQFTLASDTHKFETRYLDTMLGPLPEAADIYRERSPLFHAERIVDPIAVFQGEIDRVVPRAQSDEIVASLRARGVPHEYHVYEGEGHGWRKTETIEQFYQAVDRFLRQYVVFA
jgi:dipeptidyl aminopeptidase/acylaminoacyl peptidase